MLFVMTAVEPVLLFTLNVIGVKKNRNL